MTKATLESRLSNLVGVNRLHDKLIRDLEGDRFYVLPEGLLYLGLDSGINPSWLYNTFKDKKDLESFVNNPSLTQSIHWKPINFELSLGDARDLIKFFSAQYERDASQFFKRYGNNSGAFFLAHDSPALRKINPCLKYLYPFMGRIDVASRLIGVEDDRFDTQWDPHVLYAFYSEAVAIKKILAEIYQDDREKFFSFFSGSMGSVLLQRELEERGIKGLNIGAIPSLLGTAKKTADFLEIDEKDILVNHTSRVLYSGSQGNERVAAFVRRTFKEDPEAFFRDYYFNPLGAVELGKKWRQATGQDIYLEELQPVLRDLKSLSSIVGSSDERLTRKPIARQFQAYLSDVEQVIDFCKNRFEESSDAFKERYGVQTGVTILKEDLRRTRATFKRKITRQALLSVLKHFIRSARSNEPEAREGRMARYINLTDDQERAAIDFLQTKYEKDKDAFFARYGTKLGITRLEEDLEDEKGVKVSAFRLAQLASKGEYAAERMGVKDERFSTTWNPRSIQAKRSDRTLIAKKLRGAYETDAADFLLRYGSAAGGYRLQQDIKRETGRSIPLQQLNSMIHDAQVVSEFAEIPADKLEGNWNPQFLALSETTIYSLQQHLKDLFDESPETFFDYFQDGRGIFYVMSRLKKEGKGMPNLTHFSIALKNRDLISLLVDSNDARFETWNPPGIISRNVHCFETATTHLRELHREDPATLSRKYGSALGAVHLARELKKRGINNPHIEDAYSLLAKPVLESIVETSLPEDATLSPQRLSFTLEEFGLIESHLKREYAKDPEVFVDKYAGAVRNVILMKEMGDRGIKRNVWAYQQITGSKEVVKEILEVEDERLNAFGELRKKKTGASSFGDSYDTVVSSVTKGFERLAAGEGLPLQVEDITPQHLWVRRLLRHNTLKTTYHMANLFLDKKTAATARKQIAAEVELDRKNLASIKDLNDCGDIENYGQQNFDRVVGRLSYSLDENVRRETQSALIRLYGEDISRMKEVKKDPRLFDWFVDFCGKHDMYHVSRKGFMVSDRPIISSAKSYVQVCAQYSSEPEKVKISSLNASLSSEDDRLLGDLIG